MTSQRAFKRARNKVVKARIKAEQALMQQGINKKKEDTANDLAFDAECASILSSKGASA